MKSLILSLIILLSLHPCVFAWQGLAIEVQPDNGPIITVYYKGRNRCVRLYGIRVPNGKDSYVKDAAFNVFCDICICDQTVLSSITREEIVNDPMVQDAFNKVMRESGGHGSYQPVIDAILAAKVAHLLARCAKLFPRIQGNVTLDVTPMYTDKNGCTVALVGVNGMNLQEHLLKLGLAAVDPKTCHRKFCRDWRKLQNKARKSKMGMWSTH